MQNERFIKFIYDGLPSHLVSKVLHVGQEYRINPLSFLPGGKDIVVEFTNGEVLLYDRVKYPSRYIDRIIAYSSNRYNYPELSKRDYLKKYFSRVFIKDKKFLEIWNNSQPIEVLFEALKQYDFVLKQKNEPNLNPIGTNEQIISVRLRPRFNKEAIYIHLLDIGHYEIHIELRYFTSIIFNRNDLSQIEQLCQEVNKMFDSKSKSIDHHNSININKIYSNLTEQIIKSMATIALGNGTATIYNNDSNMTEQIITIDYGPFMYDISICWEYFCNDTLLIMYKEDSYY